MRWPEQEPLRTPRYDLVPLAVDHATGMAEVLADPSLYRFTGGGPPSVADLERRYAAQVAGAPGGDQWWLTWVLRDRADGVLVGFVQATVTGGPADLTAEVAWVVGAPFQGRGAAAEAGSATTAWLSERGVRTVVAHIHPDHEASRRVATRMGMAATDVVVDGETRWVLPDDAAAPSGSVASPRSGGRDRQPTRLPSSTSRTDA